MKVSEEDIRNALIKCDGIIAWAARSLRVDRSSLHKRIQRSEFLREVLKHCIEETLDEAEGQLFKLIRDGDPKAVKWYLEKKGKSRGYGKESPEISTLSHEKVDKNSQEVDLSKLELGELKQLEILMQKVQG